MCMSHRSLYTVQPLCTSPPSSLRIMQQSRLTLSFLTCLLISLVLRSTCLLRHLTPSRILLPPSTASVCVQSRAGSLATYMASRSGGGGGSTKLDRKTSIQTDTASKLRDEIEKDWRLILHDDNVHTIQQVCEILGSTCPLCAGPRAYEVTLEVHMTGAGTVAVANKKIIEEYSKSLQQAGLTVSMSPDDEFESE